MFDLIFLEPNLDGLGVFIFLLLLAMIGLPIILALIGLLLWVKKKKQGAKLLWIIAVVYLLVSLGLCASMM